MTAWAAQALLGSGMVMLILLLVRVIFADVVGARALYLLWALPALRMVLPPLPAPMSAPSLTTPLEVIVLTSKSGAGASSFAPLLPALWLAGVALFALGQAVAYRRFVQRALAGAVSAGEVDGIPVFATPAVAGPVAIGPLRPRILVPADFGAQPAAERVLALRHEAMHHKRGDLWANLLACALLALHWFNPLAHFAHRAFRRDQELACDAAVIGAADVATRHVYGRALARAAGALPPAPATTLGEASTLKRRLHMLKAHRARTSWPGRVGLVATGIAALGATATGGVAQTAPEREGIEKGERVERFVIRRRDGATPDDIARMQGREREPNTVVRDYLRERSEGGNPEAIVGRECGDGERFETSTAGDGGKEIKVILCQKGGGGDRLTTLRNVRERVAANDRLTAEEKARVEAALGRAIAEASRAR